MTKILCQSNKCIFCKDGVCRNSKIDLIVPGKPVADLNQRAIYSHYCSSMIEMPDLAEDEEFKVNYMHDAFMKYWNFDSGIDPTKIALITSIKKEENTNE